MSFDSYCLDAFGTCCGANINHLKESALEEVSKALNIIYRPIFFIVCSVEYLNSQISSLANHFAMHFLANDLNDCFKYSIFFVVFLTESTVELTST
jgi:hypothetical protein